MSEVYRSPWFDLEGYLACTVRYEDGSKRTVLQHREVMERVLGRELLSSELVHHKDEDKRNNDPSNLELQTRSSHAKLHADERLPEIMSLICLQCDKPFTRRANQEKHFRKQGKSGPFCGKSCAGRWSRAQQLRQGGAAR